MSIERTWERQGPVAFTADGGADGLVTVGDVVCFKVKQKVVLKSDAQPDLPLQVKRVISFTQLIVGPFKSKQKTGNTENNLLLRENISAYLLADNATIHAAEQPKTKIPPIDITQATFEHEPTNAVRTIGVDKIGVPWGKNNPLPVDPGPSGTALKHLQFGSFIDTSETTVATFTAVADTKINTLWGEAQTFGAWRMYRDSVSMVNLVAVKRTSPTVRTAQMRLETPEAITSGNDLIITFEAERYRTSLLGATATTFVRLEGAF